MDLLCSDDDNLYDLYKTTLTYIFFKNQIGPYFLQIWLIYTKW